MEIFDKECIDSKNSQDMLWKQIMGNNLIQQNCDKILVQNSIQKHFFIIFKKNLRNFILEEIIKLQLAGKLSQYQYLIKEQISILYDKIILYFYGIVLPDVQIKEHYELHKAIFQNNLPKIRNLCHNQYKNNENKYNYQFKIYPNKSDLAGLSALDLAIRLSQRDAIIVLGDNGCDPNISSSPFNYCPLSLSVVKAKTQYVQSLIGALHSIRQTSFQEKTKDINDRLLQIPNFTCDLCWEQVSSYIPFLKKWTPNDTYRIYKYQDMFRIDMGLLDQQKKWTKGNWIILYKNSQLLLIDQEKKIINNLMDDLSSQQVEQKIDQYMKKEISTRDYVLQSCDIQQSKSWKGDNVKDKVQQIQTQKFSAKIQYCQFQPQNDNYKSVQFSKFNNFEQYQEYVYQNQIIPNLDKIVQESGIIKNLLEFQQNYKNSQKLAKNMKVIQADFWLTDQLKVKFSHILPVLELISCPFPHFLSLRDLITKLSQETNPNFFPVKISLPLFMTINTQIQFKNFNYPENFESGIFNIDDQIRKMYKPVPINKINLQGNNQIISQPLNNNLQIIQQQQRQISVKGQKNLMIYGQNEYESDENEDDDYGDEDQKRTQQLFEEMMQQDNKDDLVNVYEDSVSTSINPSKMQSIDQISFQMSRQQSHYLPTETKEPKFFSTMVNNEDQKAEKNKIIQDKLDQFKNEKYKDKNLLNEQNKNKLNSNFQSNVNSSEFLHNVSEKKIFYCTTEISESKFNKNQKNKPSYQYSPLQKDKNNNINSQNIQYQKNEQQQKSFNYQQYNKYSNQKIISNSIEARNGQQQQLQTQLNENQSQIIQIQQPQQTQFYQNDKYIKSKNSNNSNSSGNNINSKINNEFYNIDTLNKKQQIPNQKQNSINYNKINGIEDFKQNFFKTTDNSSQQQHIVNNNNITNKNNNDSYDCLPKDFNEFKQSNNYNNNSNSNTTNFFRTQVSSNYFKSQYNNNKNINSDNEQIKNDILKCEEKLTQNRQQIYKNQNNNINNNFIQKQNEEQYQIANQGQKLQYISQSQSLAGKIKHFNTKTSNITQMGGNRSIVLQKKESKDKDQNQQNKEDQQYLDQYNNNQKNVQIIKNNTSNGFFNTIGCDSDKKIKAQSFTCEQQIDKDYGIIRKKPNSFLNSDNQYTNNKNGNNKYSFNDNQNNNQQQINNNVQKLKEGKNFNISIDKKKFNLQQQYNKNFINSQNNLGYENQQEIEQSSKRLATEQPYTQSYLNLNKNLKNDYQFQQNNNNNQFLNQNINNNNQNYNNNNNSNSNEQTNNDSQKNNFNFKYNSSFTKSKIPQSVTQIKKINLQDNNNINKDSFKIDGQTQKLIYKDNARKINSFGSNEQAKKQFNISTLSNQSRGDSLNKNEQINNDNNINNTNNIGRPNINYKKEQNVYKNINKKSFNI